MNTNTFSDNDITFLPISSHLSEAVDQLIQLSKEKSSPDGRVESVSDWIVVEAIFKIFVFCYPEEYKIFAKTQKEQQAIQANQYGSVREAGGAEIRHTLEIPQRFFQMMNVFYPKQKWDQKFTRQLALKFPVMKIAEKI